MSNNAQNEWMQFYSKSYLELKISINKYNEVIKQDIF